MQQRLPRSRVLQRDGMLRGGVWPVRRRGVFHRRPAGLQRGRLLLYGDRGDGCVMLGDRQRAMLPETR